MDAVFEVRVLRLSEVEVRATALGILKNSAHDDHFNPLLAISFNQSRVNFRVLCSVPDPEEDFLIPLWIRRLNPSLLWICFLSRHCISRFVTLTPSWKLIIISLINLIYSWTNKTEFSTW